MEINSRELDAHLEGNHLHGDETDQHVGRCQARYTIDQTARQHISNFHRPADAAEWLIAARDQGALTPVAVVDGRSGVCLAKSDTLANLVPDMR